MNRSLGLALLLFPLSAPPLFAQQFQEQPGKIPGPIVWSEGVEAFDANGDGLVDILYTNGIGFSSAGGMLAPTFLINQGPVLGFLNATASKIPAGFVQQGKNQVACDVDNDGDEDVVFANAFLNQPRILINDGTGTFTDETAARLPAMNLNSFAVACGDLDNDGDSDLVFCDSGPNTFSAPGGTAKMLFNDGTGHFADASAQLNAVAKVAAQTAAVVDVDNDFHLDVVIGGRTPGQQVYLNDGAANFTYFASMLPSGSSNVYSIDFADLDLDTDEDAFYISLSSFNEGTAQNNLVPSGTLSFTGSTGTLTGLNGHDDNDLAFLDADNNGILDAIVASLSNNKEKLYLNAGTFAAASFVFQTAGFTTLTDSSLDLAVADFDQDGRYDVVTAQGESGNFTNRYYKNTGPADTVAPFIGRVESGPATVPLAEAQAGVVRRAWVQDGVVDDGKTFVGASLDWTTDKGGAMGSGSAPMRYSGGGIFRGSIQPAPSPTGLVGMDVSYKIHATDPFANASDSAATVFRICGWENYGTPDAVNKMTISSLLDPTLGQTMTVFIGSGPPAQPGILVIGFARSSFPVVGGTLLVDLTGAFLFNFTTGAVGSAIIPIFIPANPGIEGLVIDLQAAAVDPSQPQGWSLSIGLEAALCGQ